jgi:hypothetical protein
MSNNVRIDKNKNAMYSGLNSALYELEEKLKTGIYNKVIYSSQVDISFDISPGLLEYLGGEQVDAAKRTRLEIYKLLKQTVEKSAAAITLEGEAGGGANPLAEAAGGGGVADGGEGIRKRRPWWKFNFGGNRRRTRRRGKSTSRRKSRRRRPRRKRKSRKQRRKGTRKGTRKGCNGKK